MPVPDAISASLYPAEFLNLQYLSYVVSSILISPYKIGTENRTNGIDKYRDLYYYNTRSSDFSTIIFLMLFTHTL